jgi:hypothetical protein
MQGGFSLRKISSVLPPARGNARKASATTDRIKNDSLLHSKVAEILT